MKQILFVFCIIFIFADSSFAHQARLSLKSHAVMILDTKNDRVIYGKNADSIMPIASISKLMTAMVILDANLSLNDKITISSADVDTLKNTRSRLQVGASFTRGELLKLALMSSENRAAAALGRTYPGGSKAFANAMNIKALLLGMRHTHFVEPTGLSSKNVSTAQDLAKMVESAYSYDLVREFSTAINHAVNVLNKGVYLKYTNTNSLVRSKNWKINVSKTGFINEAGRCLVMQAKISGKSIVIVLLNSWGKNTRIGDANRVRKWMEANLGHQQISNNQTVSNAELISLSQTQN
jgi:D-alanyl-D-alanine endopeptidase (penicillin-binding protein 7)